MDYVAMQSCTSGRNAFFTGMYPRERDFRVIVWHLILDRVSMRPRSCGSSGGSPAARQPTVYPISES
jgi:hypothetical protein